MNIPLLFQDNGWLAVDKPSGVSVHNNEDPQNLIQLLQSQLGLKKLFPIHRLDKETSGIQLLALDEDHAKKYSVEFQNRQVEKIYEGLLRGQLKENDGVWDQPLTDKSEGRKNPSGQARDRVDCETRYKVIQKNNYFTHCEFNLITGRQHQIRKHAALANHSLVGDPRYGDSKYNLKIGSIYKTHRLFLHCSKIKILGQTLICESHFSSFLK